MFPGWLDELPAYPRVRINHSTQGWGVGIRGDRDTLMFVRNLWTVGINHSAEQTRASVTVFENKSIVTVLRWEALCEFRSKISLMKKLDVK